MKLTKYLIATDGKQNIPVFFGNPEFYINTDHESSAFKFTNTKAKDICIKIRREQWDIYISFLDRAKSNCNAINRKEYNLFNYITDGEDSAFVPDCTLLNYFTKFCKENNCLNVLYDSLYEIYKIIPNENPNVVVINSDLVALIEHSKSDIEFGWINKTICENQF